MCRSIILVIVFEITHFLSSSSFFSVSFYHRPLLHLLSLRALIIRPPFSLGEPSHFLSSVMSRRKAVIIVTCAVKGSLRRYCGKNRARIVQLGIVICSNIVAKVMANGLMGLCKRLSAHRDVVRSYLYCFIKDFFFIREKAVTKEQGIRSELSVSSPLRRYNRGYNVNRYCELNCSKLYVL